MSPENAQSAAPVEVKGLKKSFDGNAVLKGIDLTLARGETLAILGRSGTGKSVFLKLIIGLQQPDSGSIRVEGTEIAGLSPDQLNEIRKKMGFLFQQAALYDSLTVGENVAFPLRRHTKKSSAEHEERVRTIDDLAQHGAGLRLFVGLVVHREPFGLEVDPARELAEDVARLRRVEPDDAARPILTMRIAVAHCQLRLPDPCCPLQSRYRQRVIR